MQSAEARDSLKAIVADDLTGRGLVTIISLRGLAQQLGARWTSKQEAVWEFLERSARRHARHSHCLQLNDVDFLIALPSGEPSVAASISLDIMRDVQVHFLGHSRDMKGWVRTIRSLEDVAGQPQAEADPTPSAGQDDFWLDPTTAAGGEALLEPAGEEPLPNASLAHTQTRPDDPRWTCLWGDPTAIDIRVEMLPVWSLRHQAVSSFRLHRHAPTEPLSEREQEELDVATVERLAGSEGLVLLRSGTAVHLPVSINTLLLQRSRLRWLAALTPYRELTRARVLVEVVDVSEGVLESRLREVAAVLRPYFRVLLLEGSRSAARIRPVRLLGFDGAVFDLAGGPMSWEALLSVARRARSASPTLVIHGVPDADLTTRQLADAATHASSLRSDARRLAAIATERQDATELGRILQGLASRPLQLNRES